VENNNPDYQFQDDIGEEGQPAQVPPRQDLGYFNIHNGRINGTNEFDDDNDNRYVQQDIPKWLIHPINLIPDTHIKVFDFKEGSANSELRATNDTSNFEYDTMENPILAYHNVSDLEAKMTKKQNKYLKRFEKEEEQRTEEAKRNGSIVEERKLLDPAPDLENGGINEPLLGVAHNEEAALDNNANVIARPQTIIPGLLTRNGNGTYRVC
jgi:hypothetical protein